MTCDTRLGTKQKSRAAERGGFKGGGFPDLDLSFLFCPFLSFLGLSRFFWDFPDLLGDGPGIVPICPFPLSRPIKSTYEEQSPKGSATQSGPFPKKVGNTRVWKPPGLASLKKGLLGPFWGVLRDRGAIHDNAIAGCNRVQRDRGP